MAGNQQSHDRPRPASDSGRMDGPEMDALLKQIGWTPQVLAAKLGVRNSTGNHAC